MNPSHLKYSALVLLWCVGLLFLMGLGPCHARDLPTSDRALQAMARVGPGLEEDLNARGLQMGAPLFIRIFKAEKDLEVWVRKNQTYELFRTYKVFHYSGGLGPKIKEGDNQAPEGFYYVLPGRLNPNSRFHLSFDIGFPNAYDRAQGRTGSLIMVHGSFWSIGCFAMTDERIEEIYTLAHQALANGQPFFRVHVFPFRMTPENMDKYGKKGLFSPDYSRHHTFWQNLKQGYDYFETNRRPPNVEVRGKAYVFEPDPDA